MARGVNTSNKNVKRSMERGSGPSPLALGCGWDRKSRVVPAWKRQLPGTEYPCNDRMLGESVTLRGDTAPSRIVGCATPLGPGILQDGRVSDRYACQGSLVVETPLGLRVPVPRSKVVERRRASKPGRATCSCPGLPYPHREASSPHCEKHPSNASALEELARDAYEGGEADERRLFAAARKAKRTATVETLDDARALISSLQTEQEAMFRAAEKRRAEPRKAYKARVAAAKKDARAKGWKL